MGEDSLLERVTAAAEERQAFAEFTHRLPAHLAQNNRMGGDGGPRPRKEGALHLAFSQLGVNPRK